ncbi:MAG: aspartyl/glutamyl-tRNA amidotransferase subunit C [Treponema sp.]|jgi:aspartyl-tRNA(Asn)/glutamyl-tRNA(Gln) amidotransferase subunit C|nr:aspartyl/glutamyl-tRNA amidotransferase subunit C [Treponema sp.]
MEIKDLQETAALARLNLSDDELKSAYGAFEEMLDFFAAMQEAGSDGAADGANAASKQVSSGFFRTDKAAAVTIAHGEELLQQAGERDGSFIVIPNVL